MAQEGNEAYLNQKNQTYNTQELCLVCLISSILYFIHFSILLHFFLNKQPVNKQLGLNDHIVKQLSGLGWPKQPQKNKIAK